MKSVFKMKMLIFVTAVLAGLWLAACETTPTVPTPAPQQPQTGETTETRPTPSSETSQSGQPGAPKESKTDSSRDQEAAGPPEQAPAEKSQTRPAAPQDAGKPAGPEAEQQSASQPTEAMPTAESKLEKAREDLRVSQATERKIAAELEQLKNSGTASAEDIRNYEIYHERVKDMVAENRKTVEKMEQAYSKHTPGEKAPEAAGASGLPQSSDQTIPETQTEDQVAALDRQLTASLNQFDAMLLKEMETIETQSAAKMRDLAQEAAEAAKRLKEKGIDLGDGEAESSDEASKQTEAGEQGSSSKENGSDAPSGEGDDTVAASDQSTGGGSGPTGKRGGRYSKEDDDIVARQLREAAEKETDPELKEKLWKEYEEYKKNTQ